VNGNLYYLSEEAGENISRLTPQVLWDYAKALMTPRQKEKYENGEEVDLAYEVPGGGRFRINLCQQKGNPRFVCRHIPEVIRTLDELGMPAVVGDFATVHRGLVLVTGATGSGKSTTLAALIDLIARSRSCHIVTIEDPIEFSFKDRKSVITQREVGLDTRSFSHALKYALRQDPDVILVGEMRDEETIMMAMAAAETGHLVLSTLHTVDASETINRILGSVSEGMQAQARAQLASVLVGVVSQRLVRKKDGRGRVAAIEVMVANQRVRDMILEPTRTADIGRVIGESQTSGMQTFDQSLFKLFKEGVISKEEAMNNASNIQDFQMRLGGVLPGEWNEKEEAAVSRAELVKKALAEDSEALVIELDETKKS
jgi:twitching motility protein PilT